MLYTPTRKRVIETYERLTITKTVRPTYRKVAKEADVALGTAFKTIKRYLKEKEENNE